MVLDLWSDVGPQCGRAWNFLERFECIIHCSTRVLCSGEMEEGLEEGV